MRPRRVLTSCLASAGLVAGAALAGCAETPRHVGVAVTAMPTALDDCNHISVEGDPGLGAGFHYDETARHAFGDSQRLVVCLPGGAGAGDGDWTFSAGSDAVSAVRNAGDPDDGIVEVTITVHAAADRTAADRTGTELTGTELTARGVTFSGPSIRTDDREWWFGPWGDDAHE